MEIPVKEYIHTLSFYAPGYDNKEFTVTSPYLVMIQKFIDTHLTSEACDCIKTYHIDELPSEISSNIKNSNLINYVLSSNKTGEKYSITSSREILEECSMVICNDLSNVCLFGDVITMTDIPIMDALIKLIATLDFTCVKDLELVNSDLVNDREEYIMLNGGLSNMTKFDLYYYNDEVLDDSQIYESMRANIEYGKPDEIPITVEGYVSAFAQLLYDPREW